MPIRTCLGCRRRVEKKRLLRFILRGRVAEPDPRARKMGRGTYVCRDFDCLEALRKRYGKRWDFETEWAGFRLAVEGDLVQNVPGQNVEN